MTTRLNRQGLQSLTDTMDRVANAIQHRCALLNIPAEVAVDFAKRSDLLCDTIDRVAAEVEEEEKSEETKEAGEVPEAFKKQWEKNDKSNEDDKDEDKKEDKKAFSVEPGTDETGLSVDHGTAGFDANAIADDQSGPYEPGTSAGFMAGHFSQGWFHELRDRVQDKSLPTVDTADAKLASLNQGLQDIVKAAHDLALLQASYEASLKRVEAYKKSAQYLQDSDWGFNLTK